jgi:hypothetical protein
MKVAILSESPADEAAIRILVDGVLAKQTQPIVLSALRVRPPGINGVFRILPSVLQELHYNWRDAEALVVVVDTDYSPVHQVFHEQPGGLDEKCRLCKLRQIVAQVQATFRPGAGRFPIKTALGVAIPTIEAWYRCGLDPHVSEAAWIAGLQSGSFPYTTVSLKQAVYGRRKPSLSLGTLRATEEAQRLAQDLRLLDNLFQTGFGSLARDLRKW